ncbi:MAG: hypothetical protein WED87_05575 [Dehalococcoidia bacterium]
MRRIALASAALIGVFALASPVAAMSPETEYFEFGGAGTQDCGTFLNHFEGHGSARVTTYFGADGEPLRAIVHASGSETEVNSVTLKTLDVRFRSTIKIDFATGTWTETGASIIAVDREEGIVIHDTGRVVFDADGTIVFVAGPHDALEFDAFCAALA